MIRLNSGSFKAMGGGFTESPYTPPGCEGDETLRTYPGFSSLVDKGVITKFARSNSTISYTSPGWIVHI